MLTFIPVEILKIICNGHKIEIPKKYTISTIYSRNLIISSNGYNVYGTKKLSFEHNNKYLTGSAVVQIPSKDFVFFVFLLHSPVASINGERELCLCSGKRCSANCWLGLRLGLVGLGSMYRSSFYSGYHVFIIIVFSFSRVF